MRLGQLDSPVLINNTWAVCSDSGELGSAQTSITISGLNGDVDEEYVLLCRIVTATPAASLPEIFFNNDQAANVGEQRLVGNSTTIAANRRATDGVTFSYDAYTGSYVSFAEVHIQAKSGYVRTCIVKACAGISGTTVSEVYLNGGSWNNTIDNLTSLVISGYSNNFGIGSRIILLKKVTNTTGLKTGSLEVQGKVYGVWQKVYEDTLGSAQTSVTISGLDGNTDVMYRLITRSINGYNGGTDVVVNLNNDTTAANYGYQYLMGNNASISTSRATSAPGMFFAGHTALNDLALGNILIYAKSGYVRTSLSDYGHGISGTTVNRVFLFGSSWNNTTDNITSLVISPGQALGLGIGSYICLEKLNL